MDIGQSKLQHHQNGLFTCQNGFFLHPSGYEVVRNLDVSILFATSFVNRLVEGIFSSEHKIVFHNSVPVPIFDTLIRMKYIKIKTNKKAISSKSLQ